MLHDCVTELDCTCEYPSSTSSDCHYRFQLESGTIDASFALINLESYRDKWKAAFGNLESAEDLWLCVPCQCVWAAGGDTDPFPIAVGVNQGSYYIKQERTKPFLCNLVLVDAVAYIQDIISYPPLLSTPDG
ncbi:unnamed protein product [Euphydryas editha]|uniref:Uncharacterized protein n=1 Tax=Euphydryas editha TaxID=104508 RepID=A0AAU9TYK5_EUPED|nr:unnamed protein product [Euphydryas editha]